jgi:hypothetical protein
MSLLRLPTAADISRITKSFLEDLQSFTITDERTNEINQIICCVCDSIPTEAKWHTFVDIEAFITLGMKGKLCKTDSLELYSQVLKDQYTAKDVRLKDFILSPETYVTSLDEVLVCKQCLLNLQTNSKKNKTRFKPPPESIICGYMIGDPPDFLTNLNAVELSLITLTITQCQSWIFFAGSHQQNKGWHTFFKGRPTDNVGNIMLLTECGWKGTILVVMYGPFTSEQNRITREKISVCPYKIIAGWNWLRSNNYRYANLPCININRVPQPFIMDKER